MKLTLIYPLILIAGVMQAWGPPMNGALQKALVNPWLASLVSFLPIVAFLLVLTFCMPRPLPTADSLNAMPWWAPLGGLAGSVAVIAGLMFVGRIGAGPYAALTIGSNLLMSIAVDGFALFGMQHHAITLPRLAGAALMMGGMALITAF